MAHLHYVNHTPLETSYERACNTELDVSCSPLKLSAREFVHRSLRAISVHAPTFRIGRLASTMWPQQVPYLAYLTIELALHMARPDTSSEHAVTLKARQATYSQNVTGLSSRTAHSVTPLVIASDIVLNPTLSANVIRFALSVPPPPLGPTQQMTRFQPFLEMVQLSRQPVGARHSCLGVLKPRALLPDTRSLW